MQFLLEAMVLCLAGGLVGVIIGKLFAIGLTLIPGARLENADVPMWAVFLSFAFSAAVGLGFGLQLRPARFFGYPEHIGGAVFVLVFGVGAVVFAFALNQFGVVLVEGLGDVFEKNQAKDDVLVFRRVHVVAQLVGGEPELGFKAEVGGGVGRRSGFRGFCFGHVFLLWVAGCADGRRKIVWVVLVRGRVGLRRCAY